MTVVQELTALDSGVERAAARLLSLQHPDGWWKGELESNATMIAEHLFLLHFLGLRAAETDRLLANELLARRRADGTWSIWFDGPADLSVTVEAYAALKLAGVDAGDSVNITIDLDQAPREVEIPPELTRALNADRAAQAAFPWS